MKVCLSCRESFDSTSWTCPHCSWTPDRVDNHWVFAPELSQSNDGYDVELFEKLDAIEQDHFWDVARHRLFTWALQQYLPETKKLLEIGSGRGNVIKSFRKAFPALELWGTEIYASGLNSILRNVPDAHVLQLDARHIPFKEEFDTVAAFDVLEHIDEDEAVLAEMHKAVRSGGGAMISVPQHPFLWSARDEVLYHKRRYTRAELTRKVRAAGFEPIRTTSFISLPFPMMVISAMRNRKLKPDYDPWAELKMAPVTNKALGTVLSMERMLIQQGVSMPVGGTLFMVARKR